MWRLRLLEYLPLLFIQVFKHPFKYGFHFGEICFAYIVDRFSIQIEVVMCDVRELDQLIALSIFSTYREHLFIGCEESTFLRN